MLYCRPIEISTFNPFRQAFALLTDMQMDPRNNLTLFISAVLFLSLFFLLYSWQQ